MYKEDIIDYLIENGYANDERSANGIYTVMSEQWLDSVVEANKGEKHALKVFQDFKKELPSYNSDADEKHFKVQRRNRDFINSCGGNVDRTNMTAQRLAAHNAARGKRKPASQDTGGYSNMTKDERATRLGALRHNKRMKDAAKNAIRTALGRVYA